MKDLNGVLVIDKPEGLTSHDVVDRIRARFAITRAGHLGTLDPMATGVLPVCIGKATRLGRFITVSPKEYTGEIRFGYSTTTYDREGPAVGAERVLTSSEEEILQAMRQLTGAIQQIPPPFSAKKIGGVPAYKLARRGKPVEHRQVQVTVHAFEMSALEPPAMQFRVVCSPGTYVRSLAHDLGRILGCGAHLTSLCRNRSGDFSMEQAVGPGQVHAESLIPMENLLQSFPRLEVSGADETRVLHGNRIECGTLGQYARIFNKNGALIAVAAVESGWAHPQVVLISTASNSSDGSKP